MERGALAVLIAEGNVLEADFRFEKTGRNISEPHQSSRCEPRPVYP